MGHLIRGSSYPEGHQKYMQHEVPNSSPALFIQQSSKSHPQTTLDRQQTKFLRVRILLGFHSSSTPAQASTSLRKSERMRRGRNRGSLILQQRCLRLGQSFIMRKAQQILQIKKKKEREEGVVETPTQQVEEVEEVETHMQKRNVFAAFSSESEEEDKAEVQEEQEVKQQEDTHHQVSKKKKNKKSKKYKPKTQQQYLDELISQVKVQEGEKTELQQESSSVIFSINEARFNYQNELKKYFRNTNEQQPTENYEGMNKREKKYHKALQNQRMKKSTLIPSLLNYFPISEKFQFLEKEGAFWIEASKKYEVLQEEYESIKNSNDVQQMFDFLQRNPYHTDALYNIGEFFRLKGNYKEADSLIQRIIYIYEYSSQYNIGLFVKEERPKRQVAYGRYSSSLFMALFKFVDILGKKGCYRAALEYCKFLLKLNLTDPAACLLCLDYNALSAKQYSYLLDFTKLFSSYLPQKNPTTLYWLPNFTYSVALAKFMADTDTPSKVVVEEVNIDQSIGFVDKDFEEAVDLSKFGRFHKDSAQVLILRAMLLYPRVFVMLAEKGDYTKQNIHHRLFTGEQKSHFKSILEHRFFQFCPENYFYTFLGLDSDADSKGLLKVMECYVTRSRILWKNNKVMVWVKAASGFLLNYLNSHPEFNYQSFLQSLSIKNKVNEGIPELCLQLRMYENVSKANFTDQVERIDLNNIQDNQGIQAPPAHNYNPANIEDNAFRLFFNTLLPWVHLPGQQGQNQQELDPDMPIIEQEHPN